MALDLAQYLKDRYPESDDVVKRKLPFVTISRETGCHSRSIAQHLQQEILHKTGIRWRIISKELITEAANNLQLNKLQVQHVLDAHEKTHLEEILLAFGENKYKSYQLVRTTLKKFIGQVASEGQSIIIGRAGAIITSGMPGGLHIRLIAPLDWRITSLSHQMGVSEKEAAKIVTDTDEKRNRLFKEFSGKEMNDGFFDLIVNNAKISDEEIGFLIIALLEKRLLLKNKT